MNNHWNSDVEIEESLQRAAKYLAQRGSEYLEQPAESSDFTYVHRSRRNRVILGGVAAVILCVIAVMGSFIGGTTSGKVDVAQAAWTPVPGAVTNSIRREFANSCNSVVTEFWNSDKSNGNSDVPRSLKEPTLIDVRGTSKLGVYFGGDLVLVCLLFEDGGVMVQRLDGFGGEPTSGIGGTLNAITLASDGRNIGLVFGNLPESANPVGSVKLQQIGQDSEIEATLVAGVKRYVAWSPTVGDIAVKFLNQDSEVISSLGPKSFLPPCLGSCFGAPTTIPG